MVLPLLVSLEPLRSVLQVRGEDSLGAVDKEEWGEARGSARGHSQTPANRGQLREPPSAKLVQLVEDSWLEAL